MKGSTEPLALYTFDVPDIAVVEGQDLSLDAFFDRFPPTFPHFPPLSPAPARASTVPPNCFSLLRHTRPSLPTSPRSLPTPQTACCLRLTPPHLFFPCSLPRS
eukprot:3099498-Rhodomonas_salina.1